MHLYARVFSFWNVNTKRISYESKKEKMASLLKSSPKMNGWRMTMRMAKMPVTAWLVQWTKQLHIKQQQQRHTAEMCDCWLFMGIFVCTTLTMNAKHLEITAFYETRCSGSPLWHPSFLSRLSIFFPFIVYFFYYHI